jgi:citrate lyase beta subunit
LSLKYRSYILVPASDAAASRTALAGPADLVVLDLEDTVEDALKPRARIMLRTGLSADWADDERCAVRVNAWGSKAGQVDRMALSGLYLPAVVLPKVETPEDVAAARLGLTDSDLGASALHVIIETAIGLENVAAIADADVDSLIFGAFGLAKTLGVELGRPIPELIGARRQIAATAVASGIAAFDMPWTDTADSDGFEAHLTQSVELGFTGCCAMNEAQVQRINATYPA